jgi:hypothetical protein
VAGLTIKVQQLEATHAQFDALQRERNDWQRHAAELALRVQQLEAEPHEEGGIEKLPVEAEKQVRQLVKQALETPTPDQFTAYFDFTFRFRRLSLWNARMAHIQRPGAIAIASEAEWISVDRYVLPDAVPIIILWPFSPIRFVYELDDTGPAFAREAIGDPFATAGTFQDAMLGRLVASLRKQKTFHVQVEFVRQGYRRAGSAISQVGGPEPSGVVWTSGQPNPIGLFAMEHARIGDGPGTPLMPSYRVLVNDRLLNKERFVTLAHELGHIFCGHLGGCLPGHGKDHEFGWPDRRQTANSIQEIEAEAVAFLVAGRAGLAPASAKYLRAYVKDADLGSVDTDLIVRAAGRIERLAKVRHGTMRF